MDNSLIKKESGLSACAIKYIAVIAMLIDHIAWCFVDTCSIAGEIMHIIGRLTAPIMTYFIAEGFYYTRNVNKYLLRLGAFALISYPAFIYMEFGTLPVVSDGNGSVSILPDQGVIYTFFMTVLALKTMHSEKLNKALKYVIVLLLCMASLIGDWLFFPIVWALLFDKYRGDFRKQAGAFAVSSFIMMGIFVLPGLMRGNIWESLFQAGVFLALIPLSLYNGKRGEVLGKNADKWFFYIFYPLHMLILGYIKYNLI